MSKTNEAKYGIIKDAIIAALMVPAAIVSFMVLYTLLLLLER